MSEEEYNDFTETENVTINPSSMDSGVFSFSGRNVTANFENKPKRYKITKRKSLEHEIDEESKRITLNTFAVGATVLATTVFAISTINADLEISQRIGSLLMSLVSTKGLYDSVKILNESIKRKEKLENTYFDTYNEEYEEKRGRSL